jgi:general secretion pathway protein G
MAGNRPRMTVASPGRRRSDGRLRRDQGKGAMVTIRRRDDRAPWAALRSQRGFTLIELLIVIALVTILASMGLVQYRNSVQSARESVLKTDLFRMRDAIDQYYADKTKYPASLDALVTDGYMRKIPEDPITQSADTWQTVPAEPDPGNPSAEPGIYNVKSGAMGTGLDGTPYSDW